MRTVLLIIVLIVPTCLNAQEQKPSSDEVHEVRTEVREFRLSEIHDVNFDLYDGGLSFTANKVKYTYQPNLDSLSEKITAGATLLSELRYATKLLVRVQLPAGDHVYSQYFDLQFDSLEGSLAPVAVPYRSNDATRTVLLPDQPAATEQKQVIITIAADGSFSLAREQFDLPTLFNKLKELGALRPEPAIIVRAEKGADYKHVTDTLDACRAAGLDNVAFATTTPR